MKFIILAGGSGVRLWPVSRDLYPKSLLNLYDGQPLIQNIYKLVLSLAQEQDIVTVTNIRLLNDTKSRLHEFCKSPQIISEPMTKNTASAVSAALFYLQNKKDEIVTILPVDFSVKSVKNFKEALEDAEYAAKKGYIAALGVKPAYPEAGFGYIETLQTKKTAKNSKTDKDVKTVIKVKRFVEKPDIIEAGKFVKSKNFYWNTGIYVAKLSVLLKEIQKYSPETIQGFSKDMFDENNQISYEYYEKLPENSIDYAVMEKTDNLAFVELKAKWQDYGSWQEIYNNSEKNEDNNVIEGNVITDKVKNSFIYSSKELVAAASLNNTIVVDTEDALLVCDKNRASDINKLVCEIKKQYDETTKIRQTVIRPWGVYTCLNRGKGWLTKIITVLPQHKLSLQSHNFRSEHWIILEGCATVVLEDKVITLNKGTSINIPVKAKHSLQNLSQEPLKILEVQKGEYIGEDDIIRYEDIYGRVVCV